MDVNGFPVIQSSSFELFVINRKAQFPDQVQYTDGGTAETSYIAGVWRDLRLNQNDMEGRKIICRHFSCASNGGGPRTIG